MSEELKQAVEQEVTKRFAELEKKIKEIVAIEVEAKLKQRDKDDADGFLKGFSDQHYN